MGCCKGSKMAYEPDGPFEKNVQIPPHPGGHLQDSAGDSKDGGILNSAGGAAGDSKDGDAQANHDSTDPQTASKSSSSAADPFKMKELDFQAQLSGDSFHTCISQETALQRIIQASALERASRERASSSHSRLHGAETPRKGKVIHFEDGTNLGPSPTSVNSADSDGRLSTIASSLAGRSETEQDILAEFSSAPVSFSSSHRDREQRQASNSTSSAVAGMNLASGASSASVDPNNFGKRSTGFAALRKSVGRRLSRHGGHGIDDHGHGTEDCKRISRRISVKRGGFHNQNFPMDYCWLSELLELILKNESSDVGSLDLNSPNAQKTSPLFVVCGACPSSWAPMQAVLFSAVGGGIASIDFWWIKPTKGHGELLEKNTLHRSAKGPHKNDPGRSKPIYKPMGDLFVGNGASKVKQDLTFGIEFIGVTQRAYIEDPREDRPPRYYLYFVWQEEWTQNVLSSNKFIKGKIAYQREPTRGLDAIVFLREYCICNGRMELADKEEPMPKHTVLPNTALKELGALKAPT